MKYSFLTLFLSVCLAQTLIIRAQPGKQASNEGVIISTITDTATIDAQITYATNLDKEKIDSAIYLYKDAAEKSRQINYFDGIIMSLSGVGACHTRKGQYDESIHYFRLGLPYADKCKDKYTQAFYYSAIGVNWLYKNAIDSAIHYLYAGVNLIQSIKPTNNRHSGMALIIYSNVGVLWSDLGNWEKAISFYRKAEGATLAINDSASLSLVYGNMGNVYQQQQQWDSAIYYFQRAIYYSRQEKDRSWMMANINMAHAYTAKGQPEKSVALLSSIRQYINTIPYERQVHVEYAANLGEALYKIRQYHEAERELLYAARTAKDYKGIYTVYSILSDLYNETGKPQLAYDYLKRSLPLKDSLMRRERTRTAYELEAKYHLAENNNNIMQQQLLLAKQESSLKQKNTWIGIISAGAFLFVITLYTYNRYKQRLQAEKMKALKKEQEITSLKSVVEGEEKERSRVGRNLHDGIMVQLSALKMNLTTMPAEYKNLVNTEYYQQLVRQLESTTKELRQIAHNLMPDMLLEGGLADAVYYFCQNQPQAANIKIDYQQYGDIPRLLPEFELIIYRTIQELVQNIYKHAHATLATVQLLNYQNDVLAITIEDNGIGFVEEQIKHKDGMGLKSLRTRIQALNGTVSIQSSKEKGTTIYIEFDLHTITNQPNTNHVYQSSHNG